MTLSNLERLGAATGTADETFLMDEDTFRLFYDRTSRPVWAYLSRITGDPRLADDLLQEAYYRFLRSRADYDSDAHRRNYLFKIASNLAHDARRRRRVDAVALDETIDPPDPRSAEGAGHAARRVDLSRAMARLKPRERDLLWLAYAQGWSHREIADTLGVKTGSVKLLLFRARRRLAGFLRGDGR
ncbi:MAG: RNA polymerase sigma factor [Vicinamibacterales bacterium]